MSAKNASSTAVVHSAQHSTFMIERVIDATPALVFNAWSNIEAKSRWFGGTAEWKLMIREMDFRVGGHERLQGRWASGVVTDFSSHYHDIIPDQRIVYSYVMHLDERKISVSLATIHFEPAGKGTRMKLTEQGTFLDGYDDAGSRERGTNSLIDTLAATLLR